MKKKSCSALQLSIISDAADGKSNGAVRRIREYAGTCDGLERGKKGKTQTLSGGAFQKRTLVRNNAGDRHALDPDRSRAHDGRSGGTVPVCPEHAQGPHQQDQGKDLWCV